MPRKEIKHRCTVLVEFPDGIIKRKEDLTPEELELFHEAVAEKSARILAPTILEELMRKDQDLCKSQKLSRAFTPK